MSRITSAIFTLAMACLPFAGQAEAQSPAELTIEEAAKSLTPLKGTVPAQWRVLWTGDASREATISWSTAEPGKSHMVHYGVKGHGTFAKKYERRQEAQRSGKFTAGKGDKDISLHYHHAVIKGLKPATIYYFVIESDGEKSSQFHFITAPAKGTGFSVIHGGDSRSGHLARCRVNAMIADLVEKDPKIIAFVHGGDFIVNGQVLSQWRLWMSQHELTTLENGRVLPIIPARGNHDGGPIYKEVFNIASGQPDWYTTMLGEDVTMVTLDTNVSGGGDQSKWLEAELKRLRPKVTWLVTQYHRPLYPAVKNAPPHTKIFCPIFDTYHVDLACESDGHCIKRTIPIRGDKPDPTGVVYVGEGGLGVGQRKPDGNRWYLKEGIVGSEHHVMKLDFTDQTLRIRTLLLNGEVYDDHSLKVRK